MKSYLKYTFALAWRQKKSVIFLAVMIVLTVATRLVQPFAFKIVVDTLTTGFVDKTFSEAQIYTMITVVAIWFVASVSNNIMNAQGQYLVWRIGNFSSQRLHRDGFLRLLKLDYLKHTKKHSSHFAKIVDDADNSMWHMTVWWFGRFIPSILGFIVMLAIAFSVSWQMTLASLAVIPPGLLLIIFMLKKYEDKQRNIDKLWKEKHEHMSDQVSNIITYKLNQDEKLFLERQVEFSNRAANAQLEMNKKWRLTEMLNPDLVGRFFVMALGVMLAKDGAITLGTLFMFMGLLSEILVPLHLLGDILPQYSMRARHIEKLLNLMAEPDSVVNPKKPVSIKGVKGKLEFRNVSFVYDKDDANFGIKNVSFVIEPGEHIAFVGHSGAGKSTIMGLLTRLIDPTSGVILLDGIDIRKFRQEDYRGIIGAVLQEHSLYNETIAENIAYGKIHATKKEIIEASKKAAIHDLVSNLTKGYDTKIGERGVRLSGGEKQRLAIARAILKKPKIVILDEPTSALDSITEAKVQKGLQVLIEGRTAITIAHRLATVRNADRIFMIKGGEITASGSHIELLRNYPEYREMVDLQTGGFLEDKEN